ncbi:phosphopantothenoylcysteine decarboxylase [Perkinsela sp. CCAP 1560/4]|nr:phosphopantothenoylcysteine decarboxylase [Perkinsela sp. CCAP 1560/4]|eukprot:KNH09720.1 phosphopantothenoylcysteine decarboxylase [Perkinsela sp. CCAP 1560/4]
MPKKKVLIGVSASVAAIKLTDLIDCIREWCHHANIAREIEVKIVITRNSGFFLSREARSKLRESFLQSSAMLVDNYDDRGIPPSFFGQDSGVIKPPEDQTFWSSDRQMATNFVLSGLYTDEDELAFWEERGSVLHIMLKSWADLFLIAPLDANTLAKIANGMADNLLSCVARAWPVGGKPFLIATAMNTDMFDHPLTKMQLEIMTQTLQAQHIAPISKQLACGEFGVGAMANVNTIVEFLEKALEGPCPCDQTGTNRLQQ